MTTAITDYYDAATFERIKAYADTRETPFLVVDTATVGQQYDELLSTFPYSKIYYAVKANPAPEIIQLLRDRGSCFDIASIYELDRVMSLGVGPERVSYGNTIKKARDIRYFYERGVRMFATDSDADVRNIAKAAPGSKV
ncbi:MAG TPA: ornithine decarboxylase, partial [Gammaproteobacteria bacterium]|nr:ornithine decarboxylase [Gammaproteobacteria bacterium]